MAYKRCFMILFCVIPIHFVLCYSLDIAGDVKDASNAVVNEFNIVEEKLSEAAKSSSDAIVNEFNIAEEKISEATKSSSNAIVNEFNIVEKKLSEAAKSSSNAIVNEFNIAEEEISEAAKSSSNAIVNEFELIEAKTSNAMKNVAEAVAHELKQIKAEGYGCYCEHYSCGCCAHLEFPKIHLNDTGCVNLTYLAQDYGISFTVSIDNRTIYNETISAHNPPPVCIDVPYLEKYAELCVRFYDLDATKTRLHGCVDIEARLYKVLVGHYNIGCFNIGNSTLGLWKKYHLQLIKAIRSKQ